MNMKYKLLNIIFCLLLLFNNLYHMKTSWADQALSRIHTLTQPDGFTFSARQLGDERGFCMETLDGYVIVQNPQKYWTYAVIDPAMRVVPTAFAVGHVAPEAIGFQKRLRPATPDFPRNLPSVMPVLLITFPNATPVMTAADFTARSFGTDRPIQANGWYPARHSHHYYGRDVTDTQGKRVRDQHVAALVIEAVQAADADVNFGEYDTNGDCYVDVVMVVHQGTAQEETQHRDELFSLPGTLNHARGYGDGTGEMITHDRCHADVLMKVNAYIMQSEIRSLEQY